MSAARIPVRGDADFTTVSGRAVEPVYTAVDLPSDEAQRLSLPGEYPYTRGIHETMYRAGLDHAPFAGFGTADDTNERYKFLLSRGKPGCPSRSLPTLMGYDSDHPRSKARWEVRRGHLSLADMRPV